MFSAFRLLRSWLKAGKGERGATLLLTMAMLSLLFFVILGTLALVSVEEQKLNLHLKHNQLMWLQDSGILLLQEEVRQDAPPVQMHWELPAGTVEARLRTTNPALQLAEYRIQAALPSGEAQAVKVWIHVQDGSLILRQPVALSAP